MTSRARRSSAGLSDIELAWLAYSREVLHDEVHQRACFAAGGSPSGPLLDPTGSLDPDLRWPGYLGRSYAPGGVLCVATVHRDFESNGAGSGVRGDIAGGTRAWKAGRATDSEYLECVRRGYEAGLRKWVVGGNFGTALAALGVAVESIAYVNAARCQYPENLDHLDPEMKAQVRAAGTKTKAALLKLCQRDYPIRGLVDMLIPSVLLFGSAPTFKQTQRTLRSCPGLLAICIHPWLTSNRGPLQQPLQVGDRLFPAGTQAAEWGPVVRSYLATRNRECDQPAER